MAKRWFYSGVVLIGLAATLHAQDRSTLLRTLGNAPGLQAVGPPSQYGLTDLERFDRTLAPTLRLYGIKGITIQKWATADGTVTTTLFEMTDSPAAYGIYTWERSTLGGEPTPALIGAASFRYRNELYFWQSNYGIRIEGSAESRNRLAQLLSQEILGRSRKPPVSEYLPRANRVEGTEAYLLGPGMIDPATGVDPQQLGFDSSAEAATATYRVGKSQAHLLLLLYPTQHIAKKYADQLVSQTPALAAFTRRAGPLLAIVYGSTDETLAETLLDGIHHEFKVTWNEPKPGLALGPMILTIFTFIGIALVFTILVGISYGGLRVWVKARYPNRVFDRPEAMELIQLKLVQGVTDRQIEDNARTGRT